MELPGHKHPLYPRKWLRFLDPDQGNQGIRRHAFGGNFGQCPAGAQEIVACGFLAIFHRKIRPEGFPLIDLPGPVDFLSILGNFLPVGKPTRSSAYCKKDRKHIRGKAQGLQNNATVKIYVGVEFSLNEIGILQGDFLQPSGYL